MLYQFFQTMTDLAAPRFPDLAAFARVSRAGDALLYVDPAHRWVDLRSIAMVEAERRAWEQTGNLAPFAFAKSPVKRTGRDRFIRNVLIAAGKDPELGVRVAGRLEQEGRVVDVLADVDGVLELLERVIRAEGLLHHAAGRQVGDLDVGELRPELTGQLVLGAVDVVAGGAEAVEAASGAGACAGAVEVTPTGAAILATLCEEFGALPRMRVEATGYGATYFLQNMLKNQGKDIAALCRDGDIAG